MLNGDPRRMADGRIRRIEVLPGEINRRLADGAVVFLQVQPQLSCFVGVLKAGGLMCRRPRLRNSRAGISDSIECRLRFPATGDKVNGAVGGDGQIGDIEGPSLKKR